MPARRPVKIVDETHEISRRHGNGKLRREIWVDAEGKVVRFNLAFINRDIHRGDNGRVLGYDSKHGVWHRHHLGEVALVGARNFEEIETQFESEVQGYLRGKRR
jgi:hypothetical protein